MVDLDKCDLKGCENSWVYRVGIIDMCEFHYKLHKQNLSESSKDVKE